MNCLAYKRRGWPLTLPSPHHSMGRGEVTLG